MDAERTEEKRKTESNLDILNNSDNKSKKIGGWGLGRQSSKEISNKILKRIHEDVQDFVNLNK